MPEEFSTGQDAPEWVSKEQPPPQKKFKMPTPGNLFRKPKPGLSEEQKAELSKKLAAIKGEAPAETEPEPEPVLGCETEYVYDSDHPKCGTAVVTPVGDEQLLMTLYLPEGVHVQSLRIKQINAWIEEGTFEFPVTSAAQLVPDPISQRTCVWYTPAKDYVTDFGAIESRHYEFDRPRDAGTCSNPDIIEKYGMPSPACQVEATMGACDSYEKEQWETVREVLFTTKEAHDKGTLKAQMTRKGYGFPTYIITQQMVAETPVVLQAVSSVDHKENTADITESLFNDRLVELDVADQNEVDPSASEEEKEKYFDYVLTH